MGRLSDQLARDLDAQRESLGLTVNELAIRAGWHWQKTKRALTQGRESALADYEHLARVMNCRIGFQRTQLTPGRV